ncbi:MAG: V-type ATP synthase subunit F [Eubacteriales bacterium]|nr:V-type ATP synthase subunit F [Eubacteriales bacterium]
MKIYVIADNSDTLTGLHLAGIRGTIVHDGVGFQQAFEEAMADKDIGILLIMESFARRFPQVVGNIKGKSGLPLIVEIPDRHGTGRSPDFITAYIEHAIGLKL